MASDLVFEIGTEEIPARFMSPALEQMSSLAEQLLRENRLSYQKVSSYGTPRRLALYVSGLAAQQGELVQEIKGPPLKAAYGTDGQPTRAAQGFARNQGVKVEELVTRHFKGGDYVYALKKEGGRPTPEVLPELLLHIVNSIYFPRPMRWGSLEMRFARPIRWLVSLFGSEVVEFEFAGLKAGRTTCGHRFLSKEPIVLAAAGEYFDQMRSNYVMVDPEERKAAIWRQVQEVAASVGGAVEENEDLLSEVNNLVEYPTALVGEFSRGYLRLPKEVLVTPMREHQRYFPVLEPGGGLLPKFIAVKNGAEDHLDIVRAGNEKVLRARLADANFFYEEDLKEPLAEKVPALKKVVFQESLGSIYDKIERLGVLAEFLGKVLNAGEQEMKHARRAAYLAKADLVTNMVYEFPELQGFMGREYAERTGEEKEVALAIYEHYLPRFAGDNLPSSLPGQILSISDKIDNITGCFAIGIQPSGSQDPYALRRQALGICHIILEGQFDISLEHLVEAAYRCFEGKVELKLSLEKVQEDVAEFFKQRLKGIFSDRGFSYDTVDAVLAAGFQNFSDTLLRVQALTYFRQDPAFGDLLTAYIRANNLAKKATASCLDPSLLQESSEEQLYQHLVKVQEQAGVLLEQRNYQALLAAIATLQQPLDHFFNSVMVMVEDEKLRTNRLALLAELAALVQRVADLSIIVNGSK